MALKMDWKWLIGIFVTIITTLIPFIFSNGFFQKDKQISYEVLQTLNKDTINDLKNENIVYGIKNGTETYIAENLSIFTIRFVNSGKVAIQRSDYDSPINIELVNAKKIFQPIIFVKPKNLKINYKLLSNSIQIDPILLNPDDEFSMTLILDGNIDNITPSARIAGITELTPIIQPNKGDKSYKKFFFGILFLIYLAKYLTYMEIKSRGRRSQSLFNFPAFIAIEFISIRLIEESLIFDVNKTIFLFSFVSILAIFVLLFHFIWPEKHPNITDILEDNKSSSAPLS